MTAAAMSEGGTTTEYRPTTRAPAMSDGGSAPFAFREGTSTRTHANPYAVMNLSGSGNNQTFSPASFRTEQVIQEASFIPEEARPSGGVYNGLGLIDAAPCSERRTSDSFFSVESNILAPAPAAMMQQSPE